MVPIILLLGTLALLFVTLTALYFFCPGRLIKAWERLRRLSMGMVAHYCYHGSYRFSYISRGTPGGATHSVLLLHGFSANKDSWLPIVKYFPQNWHVVCLDMPGHAGTSRTTAEDYSYPGQVHRLHQFVQSVGLDKRPFHLVGTSMGGHVAGVYAAQYPANVCSLTLICPSGLICPTETKFMVDLRESQERQQIDSIALIPSTLQELRNLLKLGCYKPATLPKQVLKGILDNRLPDNAFYKELFIGMINKESVFLLHNSLHLITAPVQVIWGKEDQVLHVSGTAVLQAGLKDSKVELLDNCGHAIALELPRRAADIIVDFLSAQEVKRKNTKKDP